MRIQQHKENSETRVGRESIASKLNYSTINNKKMISWTAVPCDSWTLDGNIMGVSILAALESSAKEVDGFILSSTETRIVGVAFKDVLVEDVMVLALVGETSWTDGVQVLNTLDSDAGITTDTGKIKEQDGE